MTNELVFVVEPDAGRVTVEVSQTSSSITADLEQDLGPGFDVNCGRPLGRKPLPILQTDRRYSDCNADEFSIWLYRLYHNSTVDGPGRRSVVQVSGCSIRCLGCYVPETHERTNGRLVSIPDIVDEIVADRDSHDGVTILGGEPFDQPEAVAELVSRLKTLGIHITIYSGYTLVKLIQCRVPSVEYILTHIDLLIDGPFITGQNKWAGEYRGSRNQRLVAIS